MFSRENEPVKNMFSCHFIFIVDFKILFLRFILGNKTMDLSFSFFSHKTVCILIYANICFALK